MRWFRWGERESSEAVDRLSASDKPCSMRGQTLRPPTPHAAFSIAWTWTVVKLMTRHPRSFDDSRESTRRCLPNAPIPDVESGTFYTGSACSGEYFRTVELSGPDSPTDQAHVDAGMRRRHLVRAHAPGHVQRAFTLPHTSCPVTSRHCPKVVRDAGIDDASRAGRSGPRGS